MERLSLPPSCSELWSATTRPPETATSAPKRMCKSVSMPGVAVSSAIFSDVAPSGTTIR
jgi:hypothetical protein